MRNASRGVWWLGGIAPAAREAHFVCPPCEHSFTSNGRLKCNLGSGAVEHDARIARTTHSERFRRDSRLRSSQDFQRVRRRGRRQQGRWLILTYARRADATPAMAEASDEVAPLKSRIGFSVNKRVGSAVARNRVKRRLREAIRRRLWKTQPGWDMILIARPEAADADYAALAVDVRDLLTRARLLR